GGWVGIGEGAGNEGGNGGCAGNNNGLVFQTFAAKKSLHLCHRKRKIVDCGPRNGGSNALGRGGRGKEDNPKQKQNPCERHDATSSLKADLEQRTPPINIEVLLSQGM